MSDHFHPSKTIERLERENKELREALLGASNAFAEYATIFGDSNFTDRYGDADRCRNLAATFYAILAKHKEPQ